MKEILFFCKIISAAYNIPDEILPAIIRVESDFLQEAVSQKGAVGLMQVMPGAFEDYRRANPDGRVQDYAEVVTNWQANINVGAWYLRHVCYREKGNWRDAITAYFWGPNHSSPTEKYYKKVKAAKNGKN